jgi:predicted permease
MQACTRPGESLVDDVNAAFVQTFARARPGFSDTQVQAELAVLGQQALAAHGSSRKIYVQVVRAAFLNYPDVMRFVGPGLAVVWLAGSLVLLVACANVANLLLARGLSRRREFAIRLAIGAGRFRLVRQLVTESLLLGLIGGGVGLLLAWQGGAAALKFVPPEVGQVQLSVAPDPWVLFFALSTSVLTALACGVLPAFHALRVDLTPSLKLEGLLDAMQGRRILLQRTLVGVQVAVSIVLLVNAALMLRGFDRATDLDTGRDMHGLLIASFDLRQQQYTPEKAQLLHERISQALSALPGVTAVSVSSLDPDVSMNGSSVSAADQDPKGETVRVNFDEVGPDYFQTAGIRLLEGRTFTAADVKSGAQVGVIDEDLAQRLFAGKAIGRRLALPTGPAASESFEVVGVTARTRSLAAGRQPRPWYYTPMRGLRFMEAKLWVRYRGQPGPVTQALRAAVQAADSEVTPSVHTIEDNVKTALMPVLIASWAASALGLLALLVAAIGLYGVISFAVNRRLHEMGVRMALGARRADLLRLVFSQLPGAVGVGAAIGMAAAVGMAYLIRSMFYGISPLDPAALLSVVGVMVLVCLAASWIPARRAAGVDPASVLRSE